VTLGRLQGPSLLLAVLSDGSGAVPAWPPPCSSPSYRTALALSLPRKRERGGTSCCLTARLRLGSLTACRLHRAIHASQTQMPHPTPNRSIHVSRRRRCPTPLPLAGEGRGDSRGEGALPSNATPRAGLGGSDRSKGRAEGGRGTVRPPRGWRWVCGWKGRRAPKGCKRDTKEGVDPSEGRGRHWSERGTAPWGVEKRRSGAEGRALGSVR
jgi:hypothetical protein